MSYLLESLLLSHPEKLKLQQLKQQPELLKEFKVLTQLDKLTNKARVPMPLSSVPLLEEALLPCVALEDLCSVLLSEEESKEKQKMKKM